MAFAVSQLITTIDSPFKTEIVGQIMGGVPGIRRHDDDVMRGQFRMIRSDDTQIAAEIEALPR
jgi:hypothetical protein